MRCKTVGRCVYCLSEDDLTDEHTIPYSLYGRNVLRRGSCKTCARETSRIEHSIAGRLWEQVREVYKFPSRKARKRKKWIGRRKLKRDDGTMVEVPLHQSIPMLLYPYRTFYPRRLTLEPLAHEHTLFNVAVLPLGRNMPDDESALTIDFAGVNNHPFERLICKIAYCEYIRQHDTGYYSKEISDFIIKGIGEAHEFIGSHRVDEEEEFLHSVGFKVLSPNVDGIQPRYIVSRVRLFSQLKVPTHFVLLGELSREEGTELKEGVVVMGRES